MPKPIITRETSQYDPRVGSQHDDPNPARELPASERLAATEHPGTLATPLEGQRPRTDDAASAASRERAGVAGGLHPQDRCQPDLDEHASDASIDHRTTHTTTSFKRGLKYAIPVCILTWAVLAAAGIWLVSSRAERATPTGVGAASLTANRVHPITAPPALLKERAQCRDTPNTETCLRSRLRRAYEAVSWQRSARWHAQASTSRDVVLNATHWAAWLVGGGTPDQPCSACAALEHQMNNIGTCESHLFFLAHNGQYLGAWQLGATHRSDPIFRVVPWMDPYAQAIHVARFIKAHGESQWQCSSSGGLRW